MATYKEIQEYVKMKHRCTVKTCWIAHAKEILGLPVNVSPNRYNVNRRTNPCPPDKLPYIKGAFKHYGMLRE